MCESEVAGFKAFSSGVKCCLAVRRGVRMRDNRVEARFLDLKKCVMVGSL